MKFKSVPKTKKAIVEKVKPVLPKGWSLDSVSDDHRWFFVNIPVKHRFCDTAKDRKVSDSSIRKIERATGFENNGGGMLVGGSRYTLDFFFDDGTEPEGGEAFNVVDLSDRALPDEVLKHAMRRTSK